MPRQMAVETDEGFGPAMQKLIISEQMFVCNLFSSPKSITHAAALSGYTAATRNPQPATRNALRVRAHRLLRDPRVAEAVREESRRRTVFLLPKAQRALADLLDHPEHADHFKAIKMARDDGGVSRVVERVLNVNVQISQEDKLRQLKEFAAAHGGTVLGVSIEQITGETTGTIIDAEVEEVAKVADEVQL
jgi:hypothetical protein